MGRGQAQSKPLRAEKKKEKAKSLTFMQQIIALSPRTKLGIAISVGVLFLAVFFLVFQMLQNPINDICSDPRQPLTFLTSPPVSDYPSRLIQIQWELYPDIKPLVVDATPDEIFPIVLQIAEKEWEVVKIDAQNHTLQAVATTTMLRFKDDVVVRVEEVTEHNSRIQIRSKSRMGKSDLGSNANRIRNFYAKVKSAVSRTKHRFN